MARRLPPPGGRAHAPDPRLLRDRVRRGRKLERRCLSRPLAKFSRCEPLSADKRPRAPRFVRGRPPPLHVAPSAVGSGLAQVRAAYKVIFLRATRQRRAVTLSARLHAM